MPIRRFLSSRKAPANDMPHQEPGLGVHVACGVYRHQASAAALFSE
jgi:hypothetical protein